MTYIPIVTLTVEELAWVVVGIVALVLFGQYSRERRAESAEQSRKAVSLNRIKNTLRITGFVMTKWARVLGMFIGGTLLLLGLSDGSILWGLSSLPYLHPTPFALIATMGIAFVESTGLLDLSLSMSIAVIGSVFIIIWAIRNGVSFLLNELFEEIFERDDD